MTPYHGVPGKGSALRTIFAIAERLGARACAVVDSDLRSITPQWIELLLGPVVDHGFDYVAPLYLRHKFDGTITNSIVYPLTRVALRAARCASRSAASSASPGGWPRTTCASRCGRPTSPASASTSG